MPALGPGWSRGKHWLLLLTACGGCALPDYHLPRGFSGTYFRQLQGPSAGIAFPSPDPATDLPRTYVPPPPAPGIE